VVWFGLVRPWIGLARDVNGSSAPPKSLAAIASVGNTLGKVRYHVCKLLSRWFNGASKSGQHEPTIEEIARAEEDY